jgi:hypothetical protein
MMTLSRFIFFLSCITLAADAEEPMLTRYFSAPPSNTLSGTKADFEAVPLIDDDLEEIDLVNGPDRRELFESRGVKFPPGASALYYQKQLLLVVTNTAENLKRFADAMRNPLFFGETRSLRIDLQVAEIPPDLATKLQAPMPFAKYLREFAARTKCVCTSSVVTMSGFMATTTSESGVPFTPFKADDSWPPARDVERTYFETVLLDMSDGSVRAELHLRLSSPAGGGHPSIRLDFKSEATMPDEHVLNVKSFTARDAKGRLRHYAVLIHCAIIPSIEQTQPKKREEANPPIDK